MTRRVVITGLGAVTPLGLNVLDTWRHLTQGISGVNRITLFDPDQFPTQIERIAHRNVHTLTRFGGMRMTRVSSDENARHVCLHFFQRHIVELISNAMAHLIDRPPCYLFDIQLEGKQNRIGGINQFLDALGFTLHKGG